MTGESPVLTDWRFTLFLEEAETAVQSVRSGQELSPGSTLLLAPREAASGHGFSVTSPRTPCFPQSHRPAALTEAAVGHISSPSRGERHRLTLQVSVSEAPDPLKSGPSPD